MKTKSILCTILAIVMIVSTMTFTMVAAADEGDAIHYYVATDGDDSNTGSIYAPFATLERARDAARKAEGRQVYVNIRGGAYNLKDTFTLTSEDKNTVYRAYKDEEVSITGVSETIPASAFSKLTDEATLNRIIDKNARDKIYVADLKALGITEYGRMTCTGWNAYPDNLADPDDPDITNKSYEPQLNPPTLYVNGQLQTVARYPNSGYIETAEIIDGGISKENAKPGQEYKGFIITSNDPEKHYTKWGQANDIWVYGYFCHDWAEAYLSVQVDPDTGRIESAYPSEYPPVPERRFYFYNLLEELDNEGEWYLDRETGLLYTIPSGGMSDTTTVEFSNMNKPLILLNGTTNITIQGIKVEKHNGAGIYAKFDTKTLIDRCEISNVSDIAITFKVSKESGAQNCYIHDVGAGGILVTDSGNWDELTSGDCFISNNKIERFGRIQTTSHTGICVWQSVGVITDHNSISDAPHIGIIFLGNENIFEYNEVYNVCTDTADTGAIYTGRHWEARGNIIRYNYVHDLSMIDSKTKMWLQAIYLDDMTSGQQVYGNVFYNVDYVALYGGGRENTFTDNIVLEAKNPFVLDARGTGWYSAAPRPGGDVYNFLHERPYQSEVWAEKYPTLVGILDDSPELPLYNVFKDNAFYDPPSPPFRYDDNSDQYGNKDENTVIVTDTNDFVDYKNKDFTVKPDSDLAKKLPNLLNINFKDIGYKDSGAVEGPWEEPGKADTVAAESVVLAINNPNAVAMGKAGLVDTANSSVVPVVVNDRTLIPLRFVAESFGAQVDWDDATKTVTINLNDKKIVLTLGSDKIYVNGAEQVIDVPAQSLNDRTVIPLRAVAESLGKTVFWNEKGLIVISDGDVLTNDDTAAIDALLGMLK